MRIVFSGFVLSILGLSSASSGGGPTTLGDSYAIRIDDQSYTPSEAIPKVILKIESPDRKKQLIGLQLVGQLRDATANSDKLTADVERLFGSNDDQISKAAGRALYSFRPRKVDAVVRGALSSKSKFTRFYAAATIERSEGATADELRNSIDCLIALIADSTKIMDDKNSSVDGQQDLLSASSDELSALAKAVTVEYPHESPIPPEALTGLSEDEIKKLVQARVDTRIEWWKSNEAAVIAAIIDSRKKQPTTLPN